MGIVQYLNDVLKQLGERVVTFDQEKWKAVGGQEIVTKIISDVENAQKSAAVSEEENVQAAPKKAKSRRKSK